MKPSKLKIGQEYFLINYENHEIVKAKLSSILLSDNDEINFHFVFLTEGGEKKYVCSRGFLKTNHLRTLANYEQKIWAENPVFLTQEKAEAKKVKYIKKFLKEERQIILAELANNTKLLKNFKKNKEK